MEFAKQLIPVTALALSAACGNATDVSRDGSSGNLTTSAAAFSDGASPAPRANPAIQPSAFMQCRSCHSAEPGQNGIGPTLHGVFGRKAGSLKGFAFSPALKGAGITWNRATLDTWLAAPIKMVPGTRMVVGIRDEAQRKAVIDYLETLN